MKFIIVSGLFSRIRCLSGLIAYLAWRGMRRHNNYRGMRVFTHRAHVEGLRGGWHTQLAAPTMIHLSHRVTIVTYLVVTDEKFSFRHFFFLHWKSIEIGENLKGQNQKEYALLEILTMLIVHDSLFFFYENLIKLELMFWIFMWI